MTSNQFICQACGTAFPSRQELDQHNAREHAAAENTRWTITQQAVGGANCPVCGAQFTTTDQLNRHTRREHQG
jgi:uncharacterized C2H2 Zn-finger protein